MRPFRLREFAAVPQFEADVDGQRIHSARLDAPPHETDRVALVVFHGWPYSFIEMLRGLSRSHGARTSTDIRRRVALDRGGHCTAWQVPDALADEFRGFARTLVGDGDVTGR